MSEKYNEFYENLKSLGLISLYGNRIMIYKEGYGEIGYLHLDETEDGHLRVYDSSINMVFDNYEIVKTQDGRPHHMVIEGSLTIQFPSPKKIRDHRNEFYPEEFLIGMQKALLEKEEDWYIAYYGQKPKVLLDGAKRNLSHVKTTAPREEIQKAFIDAANYCMMGYYLVEGAKKEGDA